MSCKERAIGRQFTKCRAYLTGGEDMKHRICILNIARINYDHKLDTSCIKGEVIAYEDSDPQQILQRVQGCEIVVSK